NKFPAKTITYFNTANSGGVFHQWKKGLQMAAGELIWIAESDDYCSLNFLEELVKYFVNQAVMLAFCRTDFITDAKRIWTIEEYLSDLNLNCRTSSFIRPAHWLVNNAWGIKNIVPNVSSALFRNPGPINLLDDKEWLSLKLCGDWIFYLSIIQGGLVAFNPHA